MENITHALEMMGQGMLGIFVVLGAIALLVDELEVGSFFCEQYGVKIAEEDGDCAQIRGITTSAVRIDELMTTLVEQQVSPTVLEDVVQDWL